MRVFVPERLAPVELSFPRADGLSIAVNWPKHTPAPRPNRARQRTDGEVFMVCDNSTAIGARGVKRYFAVSFCAPLEQIAA